MDDTKLNDPDDCETTVAQLTERTAQLQEENEQLRQAAETFGELAERLNETLQDARREAATASPDE